MKFLLIVLLNFFRPLKRYPMTPSKQELLDGLEKADEKTVKKVLGELEDIVLKKFFKK